MIRATYLQNKPDDVDFVFVVCRVGDLKLRTLLTVEQRRFGDVMEVDCVENMDCESVPFAFFLFSFFSF